MISLLSTENQGARLCFHTSSPEWIALLATRIPLPMLSYHSDAELFVERLNHCHGLFAADAVVDLFAVTMCRYEFFSAQHRGFCKPRRDVARSGITLLD